MKFSPEFNPQDLRVLFEKRNGNVIAAYTSDFKGHLSFHIRVLFEDQDGNMRPTKEGISVPDDKRAELLAAIGELK
jgi:hypothetical protein